jgi:hypothetical protein
VTTPRISSTMTGIVSSLWAPFRSAVKRPLGKSTAIASCPTFSFGGGNVGGEPRGHWGRSCDLSFGKLGLNSRQVLTQFWVCLHNPSCQPACPVQQDATPANRSSQSASSRPQSPCRSANSSQLRPLVRSSPATIRSQPVARVGARSSCCSRGLPRACCRTLSAKPGLTSTPPTNLFHGDSSRPCRPHQFRCGSPFQAQSCPAGSLLVKTCSS